MNEEVINKLQEIFTPVAEKIGQGAQFGWEVVMRQQIALGVSGLIIGAILTTLGFMCAISFFRFTKKDEWWENADIDTVMILIAIACPFLFFIGMFNIYDGTLHLINPAYYALEFFINLAK